MSKLISEYSLPRGWALTKLDDICELIGGGTPSRQNPEYFNGDILWLTPTEIPKNKIIKIKDSKEKITELGLKKSSAKIIPKNSVLLTSRASIGYVAIADTDVTTNQGFASFVCSNVIHNPFLAYWLFGNKDFLKSKAKGTTFKEISKSTLRELELRLPPLNEQKRIVEKIEGLFSLIDHMIQMLKENKKKIITYKNAFLNVNFKKEWDVKSLDDLTLSIRDGTHNPPVRIKKGKPLLSAKHIQNGFIDWGENPPKISELDFNEITKNNSIEKDNLLLTIVGTLGRSCVVESSEQFTVQRSVAILKFKDGVIPMFIKYYFDTLKFQNDLKSNAKGVAQVGVYLNKLKKFEIPVPSYMEQKIVIDKIIETFSLIEKYFETSELLIYFLKNLKKSIFKLAFEGKLVPQDPNDEPVEILLQKIKQEKEQLKQKQKASRRSKNVK